MRIATAGTRLWITPLFLILFLLLPTALEAANSGTFLILSTSQIEWKQLKASDLLMQCDFED